MTEAEQMTNSGRHNLTMMNKLVNQNTENWVPSFAGGLVIGENRSIEKIKIIAPRDSPLKVFFNTHNQEILRALVATNLLMTRLKNEKNSDQQRNIPVEKQEVPKNDTHKVVNSNISKESTKMENSSTQHVKLNPGPIQKQYKMDLDIESDLKMEVEIKEEKVDDKQSHSDSSLDLQIQNINCPDNDKLKSPDLLKKDMEDHNLNVDKNSHSTEKFHIGDLKESFPDRVNYNMHRIDNDDLHTALATEDPLSIKLFPCDVCLQVYTFTNLP